MLSSPRRIQFVFLMVNLLFAAVIGWLGLRLFQQDRDLARQRRREQLEAVADRLTGELYRRLAELEDALANPARAGIPPGAVLMRGSHDGMEARPADALLYYPVLAPAPEPPPASLFAEGESLEFLRNDPARAAAVFRPATRSPSTAVRAAALLRLGRNLRKAGQPSEALTAYEELAALGAEHLGGLPAELVAREARCALLEERGRLGELEREARVLYDKLSRGQWQLLHSSYQFQIEQAIAWLGKVPEPSQNTDKAALSEAASTLWNQWLREPAGKGRRILGVAGHPVLVVWTSDAQQVSALLVRPSMIESTLAEAGSFSAALIDSLGQSILGRLEPAPALRVERTPAATKLPWTLQVVALDDGTAEIAGRRWIFGVGFGLLVLLLGAVSCLVVRTMGKEMAVARLQTDFVSAVSHEFRSPLSSICQISELLSSDRWPSEGHRRRSHEILEQESSRLRRLVEGLLDFARIEAGAAHYRLEPLAPEELVRSVIDEFRSQPAALGFDIGLSAAPGLPDIRADREALGRAVWNLLDNAVKYSEDSRQVDTEILLAGGRLAIRVRDRGIGIPDAEQKDIFRKFIRGNEAKARGLKGTGIGLAMVRHIVEGHGGEIRLESKPGQGSTFTILIPTERLT